MKKLWCSTAGSHDVEGAYEFYIKSKLCMAEGGLISESSLLIHLNYNKGYAAMNRHNVILSNHHMKQAYNHAQPRHPTQGLILDKQ